MLTKSRGAIAASALAIAAVGGSVVVIRAAAAGPALAASAALPVPVGSAATATVPSAAGAGAVLNGTGSAGIESADGGSAGTGTAGTGTARTGSHAPSPGATALPADGAVPGASQALRALAAARAATTDLPHSPRLLSELTGPAPAASAAGSVVASAAATSVAGIDVAGYQHQNGATIAWSQVAAAGYKFAAVKGTEGDYYVNPWAATDLAQAKAAGLDVTPYHFAIPSASTGAQQAQYAVEYSGYAPGGQMLPVMLDIEYDPYVSSDHTNECYGLTAGQMTGWIGAFVAQARSLTGQYPVIYTTADWWDTCTGGSAAFGADPMWVAAYGFTSPPMPAGWPAWTFWQYTSGGTVPGVDTPGQTDLSWLGPRVVGLINPGGQASRLHAKVSVTVGSLAALAREPLAYSATGLPAGLTFGADGVITGTVTSGIKSILPATYRVTLSAKNAAGVRSTVAFSWQVSASCPRYLANGVCPGR